jgi:hypothetical protein
MNFLDPNHGASVKIERYMSIVGRIIKGDGPEIQLEWGPSIVLRPDRLKVRADIKVHIPWYVRWFTWLPVPRIRKIWVNDNDDYAWTVIIVHPFQNIRTRIHTKRQHEALASCQLVSIRVGNTECIIGSGIPLMAFYYDQAPRLDLPTIEPGQKVFFQLTGIATCDFTLVVYGYSASSEDVSIPRDKV